MPVVVPAPMIVVKSEGAVVTIVLLIIAAACGGLMLIYTARKRAERAAAELQAKARAARNKVRVPEVSNNLKGVTASQTISPLKPVAKDRAA